MPLDREAILAALRALDKKDPQRKVFGAIAHQYRLNPPLRAATLAAFERQRHISLPEDYRYFITVVGNGGAGPYYGLFRFGEEDDNDGYCKWEDGHLIGDLAADFPHSKAWNVCV